jgi:hypothetical protein
MTQVPACRKTVEPATVQAALVVAGSTERPARQTPLVAVTV